MSQEAANISYTLTADPITIFSSAGPKITVAPVSEITDKKQWRHIVLNFKTQLHTKWKPTFSNDNYNTYWKKDNYFKIWRKWFKKAKEQRRAR